MAKKSQKFHKISCIHVCALCSISVTKIATPTFFNILLEILKLASQLNLAAIVLTRF